MALVSTHALSSNDTRVLAALFDPEASVDKSNRVVDSKLPSPQSDSSIDPSILKQENDALHLLNSIDPCLDDIQTAFSHLNNICERAPNYASGWCNRAQATRIYLSKSSVRENETEAQRFSRLGKENPYLIQQLFDDLSRAISLASDSQLSAKLTAASTPTVSRTNPQGTRVLAAAHTHRGYLIWLLSRSEEEFDSDVLPSPFVGSSMQSLEEIASGEFALGAKYGNQIAKQVSVKTNPYAKLCGSIVKEAMRKELMEHVNELGVK